MDVQLGGLAKTWETAIKAAAKAKKEFTTTGEICSLFFTGSMDAMWGNSFRRRFLGNLPSPQFQLTINRTRDLTSVVGPTLMWRQAGRTVEDYRKLEVDPAVLPVLQGMHPESPEAQAMAMQFAEEQRIDALVADTRNKLVERYLNYSQREQIGGGIVTESRVAILDALIKGRGVLKVDTYKPHGENYDLTGAFRIDVDDFFVDPNCTQPNLSNAKWIAIRHRQPYWEVERRFKWPEGSLKGRGASLMSEEASMFATPRPLKNKRDSKEQNDLITWYEIYSLCGVGTRFPNAGSSEFAQAFEETVGDEAYICIAPGVPELLNFRNEEASVAEMEQLKPLLDWPIPYYKDGRWPVAILDFWENPKSSWPLATVSAGLGQLTIINIILSTISERIYRDSLDKFAINDILDSDTKKKILSLQHEVMGLNPAAGDDIRKFISYIERPPLNFDIWRLVGELSTSFDKAVGLMDMQYGMNPGGKVTRTAADANLKGEAVSVRPEFMASRVEDWQTEVANIERIAAGYSVKGESLVPLLGKGCAALWTELITKADPSVYMREMRARIEANSTKRPNKSREVQNMQQMSSFLLPVAQWYAGTTGNTDPLNAIVKGIGDSIEQETEDWIFPPVQQQQPEISPEEQAAIQEAQEMQKEDMMLAQAKKAAEVQKMNLENQGLAHQMMDQGVGVPLESLGEVEPINDTPAEEFESLPY